MQNPLTTRRAVRLAGLYAGAGGVISLAGWVLDVPRLTDWDADGISIQPNAALCVIISAIALLALAAGRTRLTRLCGSIVLLIGGATLLQWLSGLSFGIDSLLLFDRPWGRVGVVYPGRMGPPGSLCWTLIGAALVLGTASPRLRRRAPALALATAAVSALSMVGYLYGVENLYASPYLTVIALQTSTFIMAVSIGIIASHPEREPMRTLLDTGSAGHFGRRTVPLIVLFPVLSGWLWLEAQDAGLYDTRLGIALFALILVGSLAALLAWALRAIRLRERAVRDSEFRERQRATLLQGILDTSPMPIWVSLDPGCQHIVGNRAGNAVLGTPEGSNASRQAVAGSNNSYRCLRDGTDVPADMLPMQRAAREGVQVRAEEYEIVRNDGSRAWLLMHAAPLPQGDALRGAVAVAVDITDRKKVEAVLRESEERLLLAQSSGDVGVWDWSAATGVTFWSETMWRLYGREPADQTVDIQDVWRDSIAPADLERVFAGVRNVLASSENDLVDEFRIVRPDGTKRWIQVKAHVDRDAGGRATRMSGVNIDITERKRVEEELQGALADTQLLHRLTLDMARPDATSEPQPLYELIMDAAVEILHCDFASMQVLHPQRGGHGGPGELELVAFRGFTPEAASFWKWVRADSKSTCGIALRSGQGVDVADVLNDDRLAGENRAVYVETGIRAVQTTPLRSRDGRILGALSTHWKQPRETQGAGDRDWRMLDVLARHAADLLERVQSERALRDSELRLREADRRKDEFLATLAHELRNPLAPIRNAVQILRMKGPVVPELQFARDVIERQVRQMTRLMDDLMDVGRIGHGKLQLEREPVALSELIRVALETSRPLIDACGHRLDVDVPEEIVVVDADLTRLAQVIANLLNNAAKFTERGGTIGLTVERQGRDVVVSVKDSGIGIPRDQLQSVFELFTQVHHALDRPTGGLGIGLSLVKGLVEMHGGTVVAHSDGPGTGSEFVARLPIVVEHETWPAADDSVEWTVSSSPLRILIVDDNRDAADSFGMMLSAAGNDVRLAHDGEDAVRAAEEFRPQVVLLDIGLPKLNGYEACRVIRQKPWGKRMLLVAVTGWGQDDDKRKADDAGFDAHMVKPVDPRSVFELLSGATARPG